MIMLRVEAAILTFENNQQRKVAPLVTATFFENNGGLSSVLKIADDNKKRLRIFEFVGNVI